MKQYTYHFSCNYVGLATYIQASCPYRVLFFVFLLWVRAQLCSLPFDIHLLLLAPPHFLIFLAIISHREARKALSRRVAKKAYSCSIARKVCSRSAKEVF